MTVESFASCGSENCPLYHFHYNAQGGLHLRLYNEYINQDRLYYGSNLSSIGAVPEAHDEVSTLNLITAFQLQYGISDRLNVGIVVPFIHREHTHIHHDEGEEEKWNFSGFGDITISGNYTLIKPTMDKEIYLGITAGLKIPTGVTDAVNDNGEAAEVTIQPGTGSYDELIGIDFRYPLVTVPTAEKNVFSTLPLILGLNYKLAGKGTNDYKFGNTLLISAGTAYQITNYADLTFQINLRNQGYADMGSTGEPRENTGGTWMYISPGLNINLTNNLSLFGIVQLPAYINVHGLQQASPFNTQLGVTVNANLL
jgi:hypothetical protein